MIMMDQSKRLSEPLRWTRAGKLAVAASVVCLLLAVGTLGIHSLTSPARNEAGCINVTFPSTLGAANLHACGGKARTLCAAPGVYASIGDPLREACRHAGDAYGRP